MRVVFLNALPLNALPDHCVVEIEKADVEQVKWYIERASELASFIRHESTVRAVNELFGLSLEPGSGLYKYRKGDVIVVVSLRRPARGAEVEARPEDLDFYLVYVADDDELP